MSSPNAIAYRGSIENFKLLLNFIDPSFVDVNANTCTICCDSISIIANPKCEHSICFICAIRLLNNENHVYCCPYCQTEGFIILTQSKKLALHEKNSIYNIKTNKSNLLKSIGNENILFLSKLKFYICSSDNDVLEKISFAVFLLTAKLCWHIECVSRLSQYIENADFNAVYKSDFESLTKLSNHLLSVHNVNFCYLCYTNLKPFMFEITLYHKDKLSFHRNKGDDLVNSKIEPHVFCKCCKKWFFNQEAHKIHSKSAHFICDICDPEKPYKVFPDYTALFNHFRKEHYPCLEESCSFVAFTSYTRLLVHYAVEHPEAPPPESESFANFKIKVSKFKRVSSNVEVTDDTYLEVPTVSSFSPRISIETIVSSRPSINGEQEEGDFTVPTSFSPSPKLLKQCELVAEVIDQLEGCEEIFSFYQLPEAIIGKSFERLRKQCAKLNGKEEEKDFFLLCSKFTYSIIFVVSSHFFTSADESLLNKARIDIFNKLGIDLSKIDYVGLLIIALLFLLPLEPLSRYLCGRSLLPSEWVHLTSPEEKSPQDPRLVSPVRAPEKLVKASYSAYLSLWQDKSIHSCLLASIEESVGPDWRDLIMPSARETIKERAHAGDPSGAKQLTTLVKDLGDFVPVRLLEECQSLGPIFYLYANQTTSDNVEKWASKWSESIGKAFKRIKLEQLAMIYYYLVSLREFVTNFNDEESYPPLLPSTKDSKDTTTSNFNCIMGSLKKLDFASVTLKGSAQPKPTHNDFPPLEESLGKRYK